MRVLIGWKTSFSLMALLGTTVAATMPAQAQRNAAKWELLGCVEIERGRDFDVVKVGRQKTYRKIRLEALGNDVNIDSLRVVYGNVRKDEIRVRSEIRENKRTAPLDLAGRDRFIQRIELVSRRGYQGRGRGRAKICISGLQAEQRPQRPGRGWVELGCQSVNFALRRDRDSILVGRREGGFRAIRLDVTGNDVHMRDLSVVYGNGASERLSIGRLLRQNTQSGPIDLKGRKRVIQRIDMVYKTRLNFKGSARVCVSGLK